MSEDRNVSYIPLEDLIKRVDSLYKLVIMAARRAIEISDGSPKLVDVSPRLKASTVALMEIQAGKVSYKKLEDEKE